MTSHEMSKYMCHVQLLCIPIAISREKTYMSKIKVNQLDSF